MWVQSLGWEDPLEEDRATHSSILAWRIPRTGEPGGVAKSQTRLKQLSTHARGRPVPFPDKGRAVPSGLARGAGHPDAS